MWGVRCRCRRRNCQNASVLRHDQAAVVPARVAEAVSEWPMVAAEGALVTTSAAAAVAVATSVPKAQKTGSRAHPGVAVAISHLRAGPKGGPCAWAPVARPSGVPKVAVTGCHLRRLGRPSVACVALTEEPVGLVAIAAVAVGAAVAIGRQTHRPATGREAGASGLRDRPSSRSWRSCYAVSLSISSVSRCVAVQCCARVIGVWRASHGRPTPLRHCDGVASVQGRAVVDGS